MKEAVVIHPRFTLYGGGEVVGLHVCKVLQNMGYHVYLACDNFNPAEAERHLGLGEVMRKCTHLRVIGEFKPISRIRLLAYQRAVHGLRLLNSIKIPKTCELVFSTQSMLYFKPNLFNFCITYDLADFFYAERVGKEASSLKAPYYYPIKKLYKRYASRMSEKRNFFIPLSRSIERSIEALHYPHSAALFPPCDMSFQVRPKEPYVINTSRLVPSKRLEDFVEISRKVPTHNFIIVGKMSKTEETLFPGYKQKLRESLPPNTRLVEDLIRNQRHLVEAAKIYLYPSVEPGVSISLGQAMGAGCVAITPRVGGGAEMVEATGTGYMYDSLDQAAELITKSITSEDPVDRPEYISKRARIFGDDSFDEHLREIVEGRQAELHPIH